MLQLGKLIDPAKSITNKQDAKELRKKTPGWMRPKTKKARNEQRDERIKIWEELNNGTTNVSNRT